MLQSHTRGTSITVTLLALMIQSCAAVSYMCGTSITVTLLALMIQSCAAVSYTCGTSITVTLSTEEEFTLMVNKLGLVI